MKTMSNGVLERSNSSEKNCLLFFWDRSKNDRSKNGRWNSPIMKFLDFQIEKEKAKGYSGY